MTNHDLLIQLRSAYQQLLMGNKAVAIQKDGRRIEYSTIDKDALRAEISRLEGAVGQSPRRPPAGVI
ncbi:MAG: hypothetical protein CENE_02654 [Candidatus Celerinatantimonas neptuna]|nr:MAG: hypothetical protein CENE_02654 [Candidatus Celerinatantimonas neptuna]